MIDTLSAQNDIDVVLNNYNQVSIEETVQANVVPPKRRGGGIGTPDLSSLNEQKTTIFHELISFINGGTTNMYALLGFAGTGKTYLVSKVIENVLSDGVYRNIAITAPTNKAVRVLYQSSEIDHPRVTYATIHKLLNMREYIDDNGVQRFLRDEAAPCELDGYKILIVDEVSMLDSYVYGYIRDYANKKDLKVIFMGDTAQIPPVLEMSSPVFDADVQEEDGIMTGQLTQIVRQKSDNPILEIATKLRDTDSSLSISKLIEKSNVFSNGIGVVKLDHTDPQAKSKFKQVCQGLFCSENFTINSDFVKIIAWKNVTVDSLNVFVRKLLFGKMADESKILVGEKLIVDSPITNGMSTIYSTNQEIEVLEYYLADDTHRRGKIKYYATTVTGSSLDGTPQTTLIRILHEDSEQLFNEICQYYIDTANKLPNFSKQRKDMWKNYYAFKRQYAEVKYNYAITCHKSQGSTYENAIVIATDINEERRTEIKRKLLYTGTTRPKRTLFLVV